MRLSIVSMYCRSCQSQSLDVNIYIFSRIWICKSPTNHLRVPLVKPLSMIVQQQYYNKIYPLGVPSLIVLRIVATNSDPHEIFERWRVSLSLCSAAVWMPVHLPVMSSSSGPLVMLRCRDCLQIRQPYHITLSGIGCCEGVAMGTSTCLSRRRYSIGNLLCPFHLVMFVVVSIPLLMN